MFTGIVEEVGVLRSLRVGAASAVLEVAATVVSGGCAVGDSILTDGVCLTVTEVSPGGFTADVMPETLRRTALGDLTEGSPVNLERALAVGGRYGGHLVQGHVDGVGVIVSRQPGPRWDEVEIRLEPALARYVAEKGSIAVSGVSLTVTHVSDDAFGVSLIPTTLSATTLGLLAPGARVNLEVDVLAKYTERLLATAAVPR